MSVVMVKKNVFEKLGGLNAAIWDLDDLHFYLRLAVSHEVRYVHYIGCRKRIAVDNLLPQTTLDGLVQWFGGSEAKSSRCRARGRPAESARATGAALPQIGRALYARRTKRSGKEDVFESAFKENYFNLHDLWRYLSRPRVEKSLISD